MTNYDLSSEQKAFIAEARAKGLTVDLTYSNRFEKGQNCPAVYVNSINNVSFAQKSIQWDKTKEGYVIYAPY